MVYVAQKQERRVMGTKQDVVAEMFKPCKERGDKESLVFYASDAEV